MINFKKAMSNLLNMADYEQQKKIVGTLISEMGASDVLDSIPNKDVVEHGGHVLSAKELAQMVAKSENVYEVIGGLADDHQKAFDDAKDAFLLHLSILGYTVIPPTNLNNQMRIKEAIDTIFPLYADSAQITLPI